MQYHSRDMSFVFFFNDTATTEIYTLSLHDALPIYLLGPLGQVRQDGEQQLRADPLPLQVRCDGEPAERGALRSEEHTSELQSRQYLVCRLLLEKKKKPRRMPAPLLSFTVDIAQPIT